MLRRSLCRQAATAWAAALAIAVWLPACSSAAGGSGGVDAISFSNADAAPCGPKSCNGCCQAGKCNDGTSVLACGVSGAACTACMAGQMCTAGQCGGMCGPNSCSGCCSGNSCAAGTEASACGTDGAMCVDCGTGEVCQMGACTIDLNSKWNVEVLDGTVAMKKADGSSWDILNGKPDPYVNVVAGGVTTQKFSGTTPTQSNTFSPTWNKVVLSNVPAAVLKDHFEIHLMDSDTFPNPDDEICPVDIFDVVSMLNQQPIERTCAEGSVRLQLMPQ